MIERNNRKGLATICLISTSGGEVGALFRSAGISCIGRFMGRSFKGFQPTLWSEMENLTNLTNTWPAGICLESGASKVSGAPFSGQQCLGHNWSNFGVFVNLKIEEVGECWVCSVTEFHVPRFRWWLAFFLASSDQQLPGFSTHLYLYMWVT